MRVRIIKDKLPENSTSELNLNNYKGKVLNVHSKGDIDGSLNVEFDDWIGIVTIYKGEYEIINTRSELESYMNKYPIEKNLCGGSNFVSFVMNHRKDLVDILK